jgi:hypothetical protein
MSRCIDELIYYMPTVARAGDSWARGFAASVLRQAKRRTWRPTPKQEALMRRLVDELFIPNRSALIE